MSGAKAFRDFRGFVEVHEAELEVVEDPWFQRLRRIRQLALTDLIYPGAEHTRFSHSLGVMNLAGRAFRSVVANAGLPKLSAAARERNERLVRLCGLLHDLGHSPFSHAGERELFKQKFKKRHEDYTRRIIDGPLRPTIRKHFKQWFEVDDVIALLDGAGDPREAYLGELISGPADVDRMDYLLRDSYFCGVRYGEFDLDRVISKMTVRRAEAEPYFVLALMFGGLHAFEEFVLARYWMHAQVYFHSVRRQVDLLLIRAMQGVLPGMHYPESLDDFFKWDDDRARLDIARSRKRWARVLNQRRPFMARVYDGQSVSVRGERSVKDVSSVEYTTVRSALERQLGRANVLADEAPISVKLYMDHEREGFPLTVQNAQGAFEDMEAASATLRNFPSSVTFYRIFVEPRDKAPATKVVNRVLSDMKGATNDIP
jgi:HD superfamily phosphohydrolase